MLDDQGIKYKFNDFDHWISLILKNKTDKFQDI